MVRRLSPPGCRRHCYPAHPGLRLVGARGSPAECGWIAAEIRGSVRCLRNHPSIRMRGAVSLRRSGVRPRLGHTETAPPRGWRVSVSSAACVSAASAMFRRCLAVRTRDVTAWSCRLTFGSAFSRPEIRTPTNARNPARAECNSNQHGPRSRTGAAASLARPILSVRAPKIRRARTSKGAASRNGRRESRAIH